MEIRIEYLNERRVWIKVDTMEVIEILIKARLGSKYPEFNKEYQQWDTHDNY